MFKASQEKKKEELDVMLLSVTSTTAKKNIVLLDDTGTDSVLYYKVGTSHSLMFKIHQDLQVN